MTYDNWLRVARVRFPQLTNANSRPTSPATIAYNCIAWSAGDYTRWWWPDSMNQSYWPSGVSRKETLEAFIEMYESLGYSVASDTEFQAGVTKVAVFVNDQGTPTHAARQLPGGRWTSKLGQNIDIEHELNALEGPEYGKVAAVLVLGADPPVS